MALRATPNWVLSICPFGKRNPRDREAERHRTEVPEQVGMRADHQATALRCAAAAAAAGVEAELDAERAGDLLVATPPRRRS